MGRKHLRGLFRVCSGACFLFRLYLWCHIIFVIVNLRRGCSLPKWVSPISRASWKNYFLNSTHLYIHTHPKILKLKFSLSTSILLVVLIVVIPCIRKRKGGNKEKKFLFKEKDISANEHLIKIGFGLSLSLLWTREIKGTLRTHVDREEAGAAFGGIVRSLQKQSSWSSCKVWYEPLQIQRTERDGQLHSWSSSLP